MHSFIKRILADWSQIFFFLSWCYSTGENYFENVSPTELIRGLLALAILVYSPLALFAAFRSYKSAELMPIDRIKDEEKTELKRVDEAFDKIFTPVDTKFGAPHGRPDILLVETPRITYIADVELNEGYDVGGAYWGQGRNIKVQFNLDLTYVSFYEV